MPVIHLDEQQFALTRETTRIGNGPGADIAVPGDAAQGVQAIIDLAGDGSASIRRARDDAGVRVNGIALGAEPTPLIHGDKVEVGGRELLYEEDQKAGATQFLSANELATMAAAKKGGPARPTAATGGRLVSLVDGKEYTIGDAGVVLGRDASCEVVVPLPEVSRRHAQIAPAEDGYVLTDMSTNGVLVNGERIQGSRVLMRADVIRVGSEEFRFYADVAAARPAAGGAPLAVPSLAATGMLPAAQRAPAGSPGGAPATAPAAPQGVPATAAPSQPAAPAASTAPAPPLPPRPAPAGAGDPPPAPVVPAPSPAFQEGPTAPPPEPVSARPAAVPAAPAPAAPAGPAAAAAARPSAPPAAAKPAAGARAPASRPAPAPPAEPTRQGTSPMLWILLLLLVAVGAFLVLR